MIVPYNYLPQEFKNVSEILKEWKLLIASTEYTLGSYVEKWEASFSKYVGSKYCVSTNNGTDALILSLKSLNIGLGDEVITVANTFYATVGAIVAVGATPVLVDSDERFQISINKIEKYISKNTKAIIPVHWGGASPNLKKIKKIADKFKIHIIEDACMGIGGSLFNKHPGTFGIINAFSMHPLKSLNVIGDGGMVVTDNKKIFNWISKYRNHGMVDRDHIDFWGVNMRLQPLQAVVAENRLKYLNKTIKQRNQNAKFLDEGLKRLSDYVKLPLRLQDNRETFALYMACFKKRDKLKDFLIKNGIEVKIHYPIPLHLQKAAKIKCIYFKEDLKNVEYQAKNLLTLPVHQFLTKEHLTYMLDKIFEFYSKKF